MGGARLSGVHNGHQFLDRALAPEVMFPFPQWLKPAHFRILNCTAEAVLPPMHSRKPALSQMDLGVHTVILPAGHLASLALESFSGVTFASPANLISKPVRIEVRHARRHQRLSLIHISEPTRPY